MSTWETLEIIDSGHDEVEVDQILQPFPAATGILERAILRPLWSLKGWTQLYIQQTYNIKHALYQHQVWLRREQVYTVEMGIDVKCGNSVCCHGF